MLCYLGDMLSSEGGAGEGSRMKIVCAWNKFSELSPILTARGTSVKLIGKIFSTLY